jgi:hypothetical protein
MRFILAAGASALALAAALPALAQTAAQTPAAPPAAAAPAPAAQAPATAAPATAAPATAAPAAPLATTLGVGVPVKDKTGAVIGSITKLEPGAAGQTATVQMGDQSFAIGAQSFVMINGAAVINATQDQLKAMIANASASAPTSENKPG